MSPVAGDTAQGETACYRQGCSKCIPRVNALAQSLVVETVKPGQLIKFLKTIEIWPTGRRTYSNYSSPSGWEWVRREMIVAY